MTHGRGGRSLRRPTGVRSEKPRLLIVTEGEETEPQYFRGISAYARATAIEIRSVHVVGYGRDPKRVVREALRIRDEDRKVNGRRERFDEVWCVFDVDQHATLPDAIAVARDSSISVAITNPCFELWILWHYRRHGAWSTVEYLRRALREFGHTDKNLPKGFPFENYDKAINCARREGEIPDPCSIPVNPGSSVPSVIERLIRQTSHSFDRRRI